MSKSVAVMQPYFLPYAGYFRLFLAVDEFVIFDCVQFPRRGWVHRTLVSENEWGREWLTLPLAYQPQDIRICDLDFVSNAREQFDKRLGKLPLINADAGVAGRPLLKFLFHQPMVSVIDYLVSSLEVVTEMLGLRVRMTRSSSLKLDPSIRGQARVIAAASAVGATHYVNLAGGRSLYESASFRMHGMELSFLAPYSGKFAHMLPALLRQDIGDIRRDIESTTILEC
jgi:hypothetical protein